MRKQSLLIVPMIVLVLLGAFVDRELIGSGEQPSRQTLEAMALASGGRERDAVAVGRELPSATYVLDEDCSLYAAVRLAALAQPSALYVAALPPFTEPLVMPSLDGVWRSHSWRVYLGGENRRDVDTPILVYCAPASGNTYEYVQTTFHLGSLEPWADSFIGPSRSLARAVFVDFGMFAFLLLLGGALTPRLLGWVKPAVALLVGIGLWGTLGLLLLPVWQMAVTSSVLVALSRMLPWRTTVGWRREDAVSVGLFLLPVLFAVNQSRTGGGRLLHTDSMNFLLGGWAFAANSIDASFLTAKRGVVQQALHGPAFLAGVEGLQSLYLVSLYVGIWLLLAATADLGGPGRAKALMVASALALLLLLSPFMVRAAALVNSHVLVGASLLALVVLWAAQGDVDPDRSATFAMSLLSSTVILLRAEGVLVIGLLLLGTLWRKSPRIPLPNVWRAAGSASIAWGLLLASGRPGGARLQEALPIALGLLLVAGPTVLNRIPAGLRVRLPGVTLGGMWVVVGVLLITRGERVRFFDAARENVLAARGGWGSLGVMLLILTIGAVAVLTARGLDDRWAPAVTLVVGLAPLMMFAKMADNVSTFDLDRLLSGGGRVGYFDSVNRLWIHIVFVAAFLVVVGLTQSAGRSRDKPNGREMVGSASSGESPGQSLVFRRGLGGPALRVSVAAILVVWIATLWAPHYVDPVPVPLRGVKPVPIAEFNTGQHDVGPVLSDGVSISQEFLLFPPQPFPDAAFRRSVCASVPLVTFQRQNSGELLVEISANGEVENVLLDAAAIEDWGAIRICLDFPEGTPAVEQIVVTLQGIGSLPDASVAPLLGWATQEGGAVVLPAIVQQRGDLLSASASSPLSMTLELIATLRPPFTWLGALDDLLLRIVPLNTPTFLAILMVFLLAFEVLTPSARAFSPHDVPQRPSGESDDDSMTGSTA